MSAHTCHARRCKVAVPPKMLMCRRHWAMVPRALQRDVWARYVPGQERRKDPSREYLNAAQAAIAAVAAKEEEKRERSKQLDLLSRTSD